MIDARSYAEEWIPIMRGRETPEEAVEDLRLLIEAACSESNRARCKAEGEARRLRVALEALRPYFGNLQRDRGQVGSSYFDAAREAFEAAGEIAKR